MPIPPHASTTRRGGSQSRDRRPSPDRLAWLAATSARQALLQGANETGILLGVPTVTRRCVGWPKISPRSHDHPGAAENQKTTQHQKKQSPPDSTQRDERNARGQKRGAQTAPPPDPTAPPHQQRPNPPTTQNEQRPRSPRPTREKPGEAPAGPPRQQPPRAAGEREESERRSEKARRGGSRRGGPREVGARPRIHEYPGPSRVGRSPRQTGSTRGGEGGGGNAALRGGGWRWSQAGWVGAGVEAGGRRVRAWGGGRGEGGRRGPPGGPEPRAEPPRGGPDQERAGGGAQPTPRVRKEMPR